MRNKIYTLALLLSSATAFAQNDNVEYRYNNNTFSVADQEKQLTYNSAGSIFYSRLQAFDSFNQKSLAPYVSRAAFNEFMSKFKTLPDLAKANGYNNFVPAIQTFYTNVTNLSRISNQDAFRYRLYEIAAPVYKVIDENWGNDVVEAVIDGAYLDMYEYIRAKSNSEPAFAGAMSFVNMDPIKTNEGAGQCTYTVAIDKPVMKKGNVEVYFTDLALFQKISRKYTGRLLSGPVSGWEARGDESQMIKAMLEGYSGKKDIPAYYMYSFNMNSMGNVNTVQQNLYTDTKWAVWVFRNGKLYYSYMALPCTPQSKVTVYEERPVAGLTDAPVASDAK